MKISLSVLLLCTSVTIYAQTFEWAKSLGGVSTDKGISICADASGNIYTTGYFGGTVDFDPGIGITNLTSEGSSDIFITKIDALGNFIWAKSIGGNSFDEGYSINLDDSGNVILTGFYEETVDFNPGAGIENLTSVGSRDVFILKLDTEGDFIWAKSIGGILDDQGTSIDSDNSGNVYLTGFFQELVDFDPGFNMFQLESNELWDIFVLKLDASGDFLWAKSMGGNSYDRGSSICIDTLGNIYTTGTFSETVDFDPSIGISEHTSTGTSNSFIQKLDSSGNFLWAKSVVGSSSVVANSIKTDASGNAFITGGYRQTADFDPDTNIFNITSTGGSDIFILKLDTSGNFLWAKSMGGPSMDEGISICVDLSGNVYSVGGFFGTVDFDPGMGENILISPDEFWDTFVQKLDSSGNFLWSNSIGGSSTVYGLGITVDSNDNVLTTGFFGESADFDPSLETTSLSSEGDLDIYLKKLNQVPTGLETRLIISEIEAYPNPSDGVVHINLKGSTKDAEFTLTDIMGRDIFSRFYRLPEYIQFDLPETTGTYFLTIKSVNGFQTIKIMKK